MSEEKKESLGSKIAEKTAPFFEKVGGLSRLQRIAICLVTFGIVIGSYGYFIYMPKNAEIQKLEDDYALLESRLAVFKKKAASLKRYEKKMAEKQALFNEAMAALPEKKEIPSLLTGISRSGSNAGLTFVLFQPMLEVQKEYHAEIPVAIKVRGGYHQVAHFFDQVSRLNRTVTIKDVVINQPKASGKLEMACNAVTYMFVESKEDPSKDTKKRRGRKKR